ncbi:type II and III secretion system protein [Bowmanella sp. Y26]|uniref:type II and III secretion system protein n=1 Tax=Bowmanella yangjiangensis TaxID=2811230 RepID=UPI001BDD4A49|nr:type II and III secretion system protein [Bowmanella yangjiangensis]MBT1064892.1 type II and III secretion system protein [Bowmanella yangjiangensis]
MQNKNNYLFNRIHKALLVTLTLGSLVSCATLKGPAYQVAQQDDEIFSTPLRDPKTPVQDQATTLSKSETSLRPGMEIFDAPHLSPELAEEQAKEYVIPGLTEQPVSRLAFNNMPVGTFINEVFGNQLGLNFIVEPSVSNAADLVTMRITSQVSQKELYNLAITTLRTYGVFTYVRDNVLVFDFSSNATSNEQPLLVSGRALPEVPATSRPVFYIHPLVATTTPMVRSWLTQMFPNKELTVKEDPARNALILQGSSRIVEQALAATKLLDRPTMDGMYSRVIRPDISTVDDLAKDLEKVLLGQGYSVRIGDGASAIRLLPLSSSGQLVIFARSADVLNHVIDWAKTLEKERHSTVESGLFSYQVQSTQASHIVNVLNNLGVASYRAAARETSSLGTSSSGNSQPSQRSSQSNAISNDDAKGKYAVDEHLNTILYSGSGKDWLQILPIIKSLDKPAPSVMVEIILAEVKLDDTEQTGIDWIRKAANTSVSGTPNSLLDINNTGLNLTLNSAGITRAVLSAFYKNQNTSIRARPRIMVKSGGEAKIEVGDEIPVLTSNSQSTTNSDAPIIQNISYRNTGILMEVRPTVHATGFVDIEINQELSEALGNATSEIDSPTVSKRKISTTVSLRDGGSVLLGGLIRSTASVTDSGVPYLSKLPLLGKLFRNDDEDRKRTELMIMVIPYVLSSPDEAEALTDELQRKRFDELSTNF